MHHTPKRQANDYRAGLSKLTVDKPLPIETYRDCLQQLVCDNPSPECHLGECKQCPGIEPFKERLSELLDDEMIDNVTYKQWVSADRCTLTTNIAPSEDFVESFCDRLVALRRHSFIAKQQAAHQSDIKTNLQLGEFLVICDFAENYAFVLQDEAQGFHWNNASATIHPFVAYYNEDGEERHTSFVVISESLTHNTVAVHLFIKKLVDFLRHKFQTVNKIFYFSDGAASQYKNRKNFANLCHHQSDFGADVEWHFTATSHGKGACDGVGGTVKRLAARASLQRPYESQIMTPRQLFDWAVEAIPTVTFAFGTIDEHRDTEKLLEERFASSRSIPGTQKLHCFVPVSEHSVVARVFSSSPLFRKARVIGPRSTKK